MRHLIDPTDLSLQDVDGLLALSEKIMSNPAKYADAAKGKILATLFYEASTRTRLSFESAMLALGGSVLGFASADSSSASKGESIADTIRVVSAYADICAMRHPKEGSALVASKFSTIPVINAGDGGHQHPTQTLTDLLTIHTVKKRLDGLTLGFCGDLKFGRTVHSLIKAMAQYPNNRFLLVSPPELDIPGYIRKDILIAGKCDFLETSSIDNAIEEMDVLYMTRVQRERFFNEEDYVRLKDSYILNREKLAPAKPDLAIMHPLPRVNEIAAEIDSDPRAKYFEQALYGKYVRMALILMLLENSNKGASVC